MHVVLVCVKLLLCKVLWVTVTILVTGDRKGLY